MGQGHVKPPASGQVIMECIINGEKDWLLKCDTAISVFKSQTRKDMTWRMIGCILGGEQPFPTEGLKPVMAQMMHLIDKLKGTKFMGRVLRNVNKLSIELWKKFDDGPNSKNFSLFSLGGGRAWADDMIKGMTFKYSSTIRRTCIYPEWLENLWDTHEWSAIVSTKGTWELHVHDLKHQCKIPNRENLPSLWISWVKKDEGYSVPEGWRLNGELKCSDGLLLSF